MALFKNKIVSWRIHLLQVQSMETKTNISAIKKNACHPTYLTLIYHAD